MEPDGEILILTVVRSRAASLVTIDPFEVAALEIDEAIRGSGRDEIGLVWTPRTPSIAGGNEIAGPTDLTRRTNEPLGGRPAPNWNSFVEDLLREALVEKEPLRREEPALPPRAPDRLQEPPARYAVAVEKEEVVPARREGSKIQRSRFPEP